MQTWKCANCGYAHKSLAPPDQCPACKEKCEFVDSTCYTPDCGHQETDDRIGPTPGIKKP